MNGGRSVWIYQNRGQYYFWVKKGDSDFFHSLSHTWIESNLFSGFKMISIMFPMFIKCWENIQAPNWSMLLVILTRNCLLAFTHPSYIHDGEHSVQCKTRIERPNEDSGQYVSSHYVETHYVERPLYRILLCRVPLCRKVILSNRHFVVMSKSRYVENIFLHFYST